MKARLALVFFTMLFGFANAKAGAYESDCHHHRHQHHRHHDNCTEVHKNNDCHRDECHKKDYCKKRILDVVFAPVADPTNSKFIVDIGTAFQVTTTPPFPAGSHFLFTGVVYPGKTFSVVGPFANTLSLIDPQKVIGTFTANGVFSQTTSLFTPSGGNVNVGLQNWAIDLFAYYDSINSPCSLQSIFGTNTVRTINTDVAGSGFPARLEASAVIGGTGLNACIKGTTIQKTYIDAAGNLLIRFEFSEGFSLPEL